MELRLPRCAERRPRRFLFVGEKSPMLRMGSASTPASTRSSPTFSRKSCRWYGLSKIGKAFLFEDRLGVAGGQQRHQEQNAYAFRACGIHFGAFGRVGIALCQVFEDIEERAAHVSHRDVDDHQAPLAAGKLEHRRRDERDDTHAPTL